MGLFIFDNPFNPIVLLQVWVLQIHHRFHSYQEGFVQSQLTDLIERDPTPILASVEDFHRWPLRTFRLVWWVSWSPRLPLDWQFLVPKVCWCPGIDKDASVFDRFPLLASLTWQMFWWAPLLLLSSSWRKWTRTAVNQAWFTLKALIHPSHVRTVNSDPQALATRFLKTNFPSSTLSRMNCFQTQT